ncbi:UreD-domain-containing protein [Ascobolus immersus RN42]|uniref:UreD-domain-containing protein n=1 Tax=Ascobolus immersus RN42 TaxID=1160509 RepID=A0A3N4I8F5_ASCIM|nr:UreD-domain-containing protein [Ascobolus immersus RN42]
MPTGNLPPCKAAGSGLIHATSVPFNALRRIEFVYPLKLISSRPSSKCITVFLLSYGGGLVAGDSINLDIYVDPNTRLCLLTQGSTKIFKSPSPTTSQTVTTHLGTGSTFLLLPDPLQPHATSRYTQTQRFYIPNDNSANLLLLDWTTEGRSAMGEHWSLTDFKTCNEVYTIGEDGSVDGAELLLRDTLFLEGDDSAGDPLELHYRGGPLKSRMEGVTCLATLLIRGPLFKELADHCVELFKTEPRVGGRRGFDENEAQRERRRLSEGVVFTVAEVRGFVVVRVSGADVERVRVWVRGLIEQRGMTPPPEGKGVVEREFGRGVMMCLEG